MMFMLFLAIATGQIGTSGPRPKKNKYICGLSQGVFCWTVCRRDNKQNTRSPSDKSRVSVYVLFTTIRENSQMVPVCIILCSTCARSVTTS